MGEIKNEPDPKSGPRAKSGRGAENFIYTKKTMTFKDIILKYIRIDQMVFHCGQADAFGKTRDTDPQPYEKIYT